MSKKTSARNNVVAMALIVGLISGFLGGAVTSEYRLRKVIDQEAGQIVKKVVEERTFIEDSDGIKAINKVAPAVVSIVATRDLPVYRRGSFRSPFSGDPFFDEFFALGSGRSSNGSQPKVSDEIRRQKVGGGTGFVITNDGLVLTNKHVVQDANVDYTIVLKDGMEFLAEVVSVDPFYDVAVIKMKVSDKDPDVENKKNLLGKLPVVEFGDSDDLQVGQKVFAIGNALALYENTVTAGIVSAKGRDIVAGGVKKGSEVLSGLIQTDAAINPGNSGGPLINLGGQVIGVNVAIDQGARSVGFTIPINDVKPILKSIAKYGKIVRPILGVRYMNLTKDQANKLKIPVEYGALLVRGDREGEFAVVPGGPGAKAGLKEKDVIVEIDGDRVDVDFSLQRAIQQKQPGDKVSLKVWRDGEVIDVEVELGESSVN